jgi:multiple sugar transport system substrate-binding protein
VAGARGNARRQCDHRRPGAARGLGGARRRFQAENPDVELRLNIYDGESYKKSIRNWLTSAPPDVVYWNAGYRMRQFVAPGLLEDVSDLYTPAVRDRSIRRHSIS